MPKDQLKKMLIERSILEGIRLGRYVEVIEDDSPSSQVPNGRSLIISYYQSGQYVCTKHELRRGKGNTIHQDVESVLLDGIRYDRLQEPPRTLRP